MIHLIQKQQVKKQRAGEPLPCRCAATNAGFTLLEAVVVMAMIAILLSIAVPSSISGLKERGVSNAANEFQYQLQKAKLLAIKEGSDASITIDADADEYYLESGQSGRVETIALSQYHGDVVFSDDWTNNAIITFTPSGVAFRSGAFYLTNQAGDRTFRLRVTDAGGISKHVYNTTASKWYQY